MRAALALLGQAPLGPHGRRIAVLGEMLELGPQGLDLHRGLIDSIIENSIDLVFCAGPLFHGLWEALPSERRGGYAVTSAALEAELLRVLRAGDAIMVKGSLGSKMGPIVKTLTRQYSSQGTRERRPPKVDPMLYWLADLSSTISIFNVFRYLTVRTGGAMITALVFVFMFGPWIIDHLRIRRARASRSAPTGRSRICSPRPARRPWAA